MTIALPTYAPTTPSEGSFAPLIEGALAINEGIVAMPLPDEEAAPGDRRHELTCEHDTFEDVDDDDFDDEFDDDFEEEWDDDLPGSDEFGDDIEDLPEEDDEDLDGFEVADPELEDDEEEEEDDEEEEDEED